ncbi:hypothetical protein [Methanobrevibacter boviskoreani]|uniref:hypothetical protein n=1 Tax=Methanobrevibacter boviskoreani TaxID=1348249 RepID=UPI001267143D|nr:hypothetical protein [Methanobrevibacter boviskoreani]
MNNKFIYVVKMSSSFSPKIIIKDFFKYNKNEKKDLIILPGVISLILMFFINIDVNLINILLVSLSIFIGFLLNLMLSSFNLKDSDAKPTYYGGKDWNINDFLVEYHVTISFEILITIVLVILLLFFSLTYNFISNMIGNEILKILKFILNFIIVYLISIFFILIFRVLKMGHTLIRYHIEN